MARCIMHKEHVSKLAQLVKPVKLATKMKKIYFQPKTIYTGVRLFTDVLLLGSGTGIEPAPQRQGDGSKVKLTKMYI